MLNISQDRVCVLPLVLPRCLIFGQVICWSLLPMGTAKLCLLQELSAPLPAVLRQRLGLKQDKSQTQPGSVMPTAPRKSRETGTPTQPQRLNPQMALNALLTGISNHLKGQKGLEVVLLLLTPPNQPQRCCWSQRGARKHREVTHTGDHQHSS